ncbi:MAG: AI-2E family transporter [Pseudomonadota bacterium]
MIARGQSYAVGAVAVAATVWLLIQARGVLEPLMISVLIWFVLEAVAGVFARACGHTRPGTWSRAGAVVFFFALIGGLSVMISNSVDGFRENLPVYQENLKTMLADLAAAVGMSGPMEVQGLLGQIELSDVAVGLAGSALGFVSSLIVVLVYVAFIFVEAGQVEAKLHALAAEPKRFARLSDTARRIRREIETYLGVKCIIGAAQAVPTLIVLWAIGVDGAAMWAAVIFFASFIPTIGSLIGIVFPAVVALVQFDTPGPFLVTAGLLAVIQIGGSNWLEPKMMGSSLNLSALVVLIAIFAGGALWGITGALIAVPALSVAVIVFARIETMRPVAILLSSDGRIDGSEPED